jgi:hypothetical protein
MKGSVSIQKYPAQPYTQKTLEHTEECRDDVIH